MHLMPHPDHLQKLLDSLPAVDLDSQHFTDNRYADLKADTDEEANKDAPR